MENNQITNTSNNENATTPEAPTPEVGQLDGAAHQTGVNEAPPATETNELSVDNQSEGIPEKWVGKSLDDVLKANRELERKMHQQSEELAKFKKEQDHPVQQQEARPQVQEVQPPVQNVKSMEDWLQEEYKKDWEQDPQAAVLRDRQRRDQWRTYQDNYNRQFEFGEAAKAGRVPGMEDFGEMIPQMTQIAKGLAPLINPVYETHPELLKAVYFIAKGMTSSEKLKKVATAKTQMSKAVEQEKLNAIAESSSGNEPSPTVDPWSMKTEDLKKLLGTVDRSVEG